MANLLTRFSDVQKDDGSVFWSKVTETPFKNYSFTQNVLGLFDVRERKSPVTQFQMCFLEVVCEFHIRHLQGDSKAQSLRQAQGLIMKTFGEDITCGGYSINITETGNEFDIDGTSSNTIGGVVVVEIQYRHRSADPTKHI